MTATRMVLLASATAVALSGCVTQPMGPTIPVMPGPNKSLQAFEGDETACEGYAGQRVAGGAEAANNTALGEGVISTALGAGLGAALGGGRGAAVGAASGAIVGTAAGANTSAGAQFTLQRRYDMAYAQCMSTRGDKVPHPHPPRMYPPPPGPYPYPPPPPPY